jgi:formylglycine-generating enzyme required for sulfatase activity/serine/threonine protein kinase
MQLEPGKLVNPRVKLVKRIGEGAMGEVWLAEHLTLKQRVAVKFIAGDRVKDDPAAHDRFEQEARAIAQIKSPHVVQVLDFGTTQSVPYIVMEHLDGSTLAAWLGLIGKMSLAQTVSVVVQVSKALHVAHKLGIIHRDIKPANIFLVDEPADYEAEQLVKVLDFGIAKSNEMREGLTTPGMVMGTPEYLCPDQVIDSREADIQTDLWALAVVAYYALLGQHPFTGRTLGQLVGALVRRDYPRPSTVRSDVPAALDGFFERAFAREPERRFTAAAELATAYRDAAEGREVPQIPEGERAPSWTGPQSRLSTSGFGRPLGAPAADTPSGPSSPWDTAGAGDSPTPTALAAAAPPPPKPVSLAATDSAAEGRITEGSKRLSQIGRRSRILVVAAGGLVIGAGLVVLVRLVSSASSTDDQIRTTAVRGTTPAPEAPPPEAEWVKFPAGTALVGCDPKSDAACPPDAEPAHEVDLAAFALGRTEVTVAQYRACVNAAMCSVDGLTVESFQCNWSESGRDQHPMNCVSFEQAAAYCRWQRAALPTEAQWERAARGDKAAPRPFPWGKDAPGCTRAVMIGEEGSGCGRSLTWQAASRPGGQTPEGVYDLAGNVREWVGDWYAPQYDAAVKRDPQGPVKGTRRVVRGGGWRDGVSALRTVARASFPSDGRAADLGFRCARAE